MADLYDPQSKIDRIFFLQNTDPKLATTILIDLLNGLFREQLSNITDVSLKSSQLSVNSFRATFTATNEHGETKQFFCKSHVEVGGEVKQYYSDDLKEVGYKLIDPSYVSRESGKQLIVYELFQHPSLFDITNSIESGQSEIEVNDVIKALKKSDKNLLVLYLKTLHLTSSQKHAEAPVHQLFYKRLTGQRFQDFYTGKPVCIDGNAEVTFEIFAKKKWVMNKKQYPSLQEIINTAKKLLSPDARPIDVTIIGHGDAHSGNIFYMQNTRPAHMAYFEPAFAGRHSPFLDLAKPLFHNVFAEFLYFPQQFAEKYNINVTLEKDCIRIDCDFELSDFRKRIFDSKIQHVLRPLLSELKSSNNLMPDWKSYLKSALFCCPFLTKNILDSTYYPPEVQAFAFAMAIQMGGYAQGGHVGLLDETLDTLPDS